MDKKMQEVFFNGSVDMDLLVEKTKGLIGVSKEAGDPRKLMIQIRREDEFDEHFVPEEIINQIDKEIAETNCVSSIDYLRVWKQGTHYVVVGVKL